MRARGRGFYLRRRVAAAASAQGDLCAGRIALAKIVRVEKLSGLGAKDEVIVRYQYRFAAFKWALDPEIQRVFPLIAQLTAGQGKATLEQRFAADSAGWLPLDPRR